MAIGQWRIPKLTFQVAYFHCRERSNIFILEFKNYFLGQITV